MRAFGAVSPPFQPPRGRSPADSGHASPLSLQAQLGNHQVQEARKRRKPLHVPLQPPAANHVAAERPLAIRNGCSTRTLAFAVSAWAVALSAASVRRLPGFMAMRRDPSRSARFPIP